MANLNPSAEGPRWETFLAPCGSVSNPAGFMAPAILQSNYPPEVKAQMAKVAAKLAKDPMAMRLFCDRIYQRLQTDLAAQQDRTHSYGRRQ